MELPTAEQVGDALAVLGNWRVLHVQEALYPYAKIPASVMLGIGYRETGLQNICGGAVWMPLARKWVASKTDRGWLQISDQIAEQAAWLRTVPGCREGQWAPDTSVLPEPTAFAPNHCPRFSDALAYVHGTMLDDMHTAIDNEIPASQALRFAVAAHNAGATGALAGYRAGDVDLHTAHGNYSAYVLALQPVIHQWIVTHPNWQYRPPTQAHLRV